MQSQEWLRSTVVGSTRSRQVLLAKDLSTNSGEKEMMNSSDLKQHFEQPCHATGTMSCSFSLSLSLSLALALSLSLSLSRTLLHVVSRLSDHQHHQHHQHHHHHQNFEKELRAAISSSSSSSSSLFFFFIFFFCSLSSPPFFHMELQASLLEYFEGMRPLYDDHHDGDSEG